MLYIYKMSGQPNLNTYDPIKFRSQYMGYLNLQAKNDDVNLQANKIFKKTGQTPSQPTDTRSTTQKLADVERLKVDLRASLAQIADGTNAQSIVNQIAADANLLEFVAQHIDEIINMSKGKWKYGVQADVFIPYIQRYAQAYTATQGINIGLQEATGRQILVGLQDIRDHMITGANLDDLRDAIENSRGIMQGQLTTLLLGKVDELKALIPDITVIEALLRTQTGEQELLMRQELSSALIDLPTKQQLRSLIGRLDMANDRGDGSAANQVGADIASDITPSPATKQGLGAVKALSQGKLKAGGDEPEEAEAKLKFDVKVKKKASAEEGRKALDDKYRALWDTLMGEPKLSNSTVIPTEGLKEMIGYFKKVVPDYIGLKGIRTASSGEMVAHLKKDRLKQLVNEYFQNMGGGGGGGAPTTGMTMGASAPSLGAVVASQGNPPSGKGIKGRGIAVDYSKGVQDTNKAKYVPFGKFIINPKRLEDDIIAVRRPKGSVPIPTQRTSQKLGGVIRKIVGGGNPSFEDLNALDENEKHYLHKLMKSTNLIDRISVPAPSKEQDDKDINRFEVLRGEIMSGNDSHQLIKEFKLLILKLVNKELLPKSQSREILYDLMALGF